MIVPMKKIHLVVESKGAEAALESLRQLGIVHVEHMGELKGHPLADVKEKIACLERIIALMEQVKPRPEQEPCDNPHEICEVLVERLSAIERLKESIAKRAVRIQKWEPWGDFDPQDVRYLLEEGIFVQLFEIPVKELHSLPDDVVCVPVYKEAGIARCVVVLRENKSFPYERVYLPPMGLNEEIGLQEKEIAELEELEKKLEEGAKYLEAFKQERIELYDQLRFGEVKIGMYQEENLSALKGFCPVDELERLHQKAADEKWGLMVNDVSEEDKVPTLLRNPKWIELIKPVFRMIDIVPGFREADISALFLIFFSIFFGILIGDAGYGAIFFLGTLFSHLKWGKRVGEKAIFYLMYILSGCTILWGIFTGTFFGQQWLPQQVQPVFPWLRDNNNIQMLCFLIGAVHLSLAHFWRALMRFPSVTALSQFGWFLMLWGMYFTANTLVLSMPFPFYAKWLLIGGAACVVLFTKPHWNILKSIGPGVGELLLNVINTFTDIVSYIRLFAVGLATVAVADAFNKMALGFGFNSAVSGLVTGLILIAGHLFNIILCAMAILVHGIRLNVLEFSGHMDMEWSGVRYNPFKKLKKA